MTIFHSALLLAVAAISVWLGLFVGWRHRTGVTSRSWVALMLALGGWSVGSACMWLTLDRTQALWWARLAHVGAAVLPIAFLRFTLALTDGPLPGRRVMTGSRAVAGALGALALTPYLVEDVQPQLGVRFSVVPGPLYGAFLAVSVGYFLYAAWILWTASRQQRWRLMDLRLVVKNTVLYAALYSAVVGLFVVLVVFVGQWLFYGSQSLDRRVLWMCLIALSVVVATLRPLDTFLRRATDRVFFQRAHESQRTLKAASQGMARAKSVDHLLRMIAHFAGRHLRPTHVSIFSRHGEMLMLRVARGSRTLVPGLTLAKENPLVVRLEAQKEVLRADEVEQWLGRERVAIQEEMARLQARVCVPTFGRGRLLGLLLLGEKRSGDPYTEEDADLLATLANEAAVALENAGLYEQLYRRMQEIQTLYEKEHRMFIHTAIALAAAVDARDPYTHGHTERCTAYAMAVAEELAEHPEMRAIPRCMELLRISALLHDVGKIGVPDQILNKPGRLTAKEFKKMQEHAAIGAIILQPIRGLEEVALAVKAHQERYDGKGYPDRLRGREIPFMARIVSVADTFDAMTTDRPYRARLSDEVALKEIAGCAGTQFDPDVVEAFLRAYHKGAIVNRPVEARQMLGA